MEERECREKCLRKAAMLETLDYEQISKVADALEKQFYKAGKVIIKQGDPGSRFFVVLSGECVATVETAGEQQEHRRLFEGDLFGELALVMKTRRTATITAHTDV